MSDPSASSSDRNLTSARFYANPSLFASSSPPPYEATLNNAAAGTYALTAVAMDNLGASSTSAVVTVTVQAGNVPPSVSITDPINGDIFFAGTNILVQATAFDSDGIAKVEFFTNDVSAGVTTTQPYSVVL